MSPIRTLVEAIGELVETGRLTDDTKAKLEELVTAERYGHPSTCCFEEIEGERCPHRG